MIRKIVAFVIVAVVLFSSFSMSAQAFELNLGNATVDGYYLYNFENDMVMAEEGIDLPISPSSTVKIMTACIALESGVSMNKTVTITSEMIKGVTGRFMGLKAGERLTFEDLLYATVCGGFNDAAQVLAMAACGSMSEFIDKMNSKAKELGMTATIYQNVTGMYHSDMVTTIGDIAILAKHMSQNEYYITMSATKSYSLSSGATCSLTTINNRSTMLASYKGMSNFNTGSGNDGDCAVLYYKTKELSYLTIVMNAKSDDSTKNYAESFSAQLISHAVNDYSKQTILTTQNVVSTMPVQYSVNASETNLYLESDLSLFLSEEIDVKDDLTYNVYIYGDELRAPLKSGDAVGELIVSLDGVVLATVPIVIKTDVERNGFLYFLELMRNYVLGRAFIISLITFAVALALYYFINKQKHKKVYRRRQQNKK